MNCFSRHQHKDKAVLLENLRREMDDYLRPLGFEVIEALHLSHSVVFKIRKRVEAKKSGKQHDRSF